jgi:hypothetical protein
MTVQILIPFACGGYDAPLTPGEFIDAEDAVAAEWISGGYAIAAPIVNPES